MADEFATVPELQARLDWELDAGEQGVAQGALEDLSDDARYYGSASWDSGNAPRQVKTLVLRAAARFMRNPDGYLQSRAGDETLIWGDRGHESGSAYFTDKEQQQLAQLAGKNQGFYSVEVTAWGPTNPDGPGYVPVDGSTYAGTPKDFPLFQQEYI